MSSLHHLHRKSSRDEAVEALRKAEAKPWFDIAYLPRASQLTNDPEHDPNRRRLDDAPIAAARQAKVPLLFLYADSDPWVPVGESVKRLQSLARELPNIEYAVVSNANHEMMFPGNEKMQVDQETTRSEAPQAPTYFMFLASWLTRHVATKAGPHDPLSYKEAGAIPSRRKFRPDDGQVGSNAVNLEHKASKVFRPKAADFAEVSMRSPPFE